MEKDSLLRKFSNKSVDFNYAGHKLRFRLCQSLFSSFDIDEGTKLLLKSLAKRVNVQAMESVLDVGCGVGVIGITLKKVNPRLKVSMQDRDALAVAFSRLNAEWNSAGELEVHGDLALEGLAGQRFDLVASNLPGKAGAPVLRYILARLPQHLTETGRGAIVVVKPLEELIEQGLQEDGRELLSKEDARGYVVFHFGKGTDSAPLEASLRPYLRGRSRFTSGKGAYELDVAYGLPEFDTLAYHSVLALNAVKDRRTAGNILFWNPGQGHLPIHFVRRWGGDITRFALAGRDLLSLRVTERNLIDSGIGRERIAAFHLPHFMRVEGTYDALVLFPDADPGVPWDRVLLDKCYELLNPGGFLLITGKSAFINRVLAADPGFRTASSKRRHGLRSYLLEKPLA